MDVIFQEHPDIWMGSSVFRKVPTIVQVDDIPILEVGQFVDAGYTTRFQVFHSDGTHIATVNGSRIFPTEAGNKANLKQRFENNLTICELEGKPILELRRHGAAALRGWAELHAPNGTLIKCFDEKFSGMIGSEGHLCISGQLFMDVLFEGHPIGLHFKDGNCKMGIKHCRYSGPADKPLPYESINSPENPLWPNESLK